MIPFLAKPNSINLGLNPQSAAEREASLTDKEIEDNLCREPEFQHYAPYYNNRDWEKVIMPHRGANRLFRTGQFSESFLVGLLTLASQAEKEASILLDVSDLDVSDELNLKLQTIWGNIGILAEYRNPTTQLTLIRTYTRTNNLTPAVSTHSPGDILALIIFGTMNDMAVASTVIGRVCGGKIEMSSIAIDGNKIYTSNNYEARWVEILLANPNFLPKEFKSIMATREVASFRVAVNPEKVQELALKMRFTAQQETQQLQGFGTAFNASENQK